LKDSVLRYFFTIADNGSSIGDGGAFEKRQPKICTNAH